MKLNELLNNTVINLHRTKQILRESSQDTQDSQDSHDNDYVIIDLLNRIIMLFQERVDSDDAEISEKE